MNRNIVRNPTRPCWLDAWHVAPSASTKGFDFIDGLRGIAILMVVVCHLVYVNPNSGPFLRFFHGMTESGGYGVSLFFCLSGFLISLPFWMRKKSALSVIPSGYWARRFYKIYPPLALSILILTPIYYLLPTSYSKDVGFISIAAQWLTGLAFIFPVSGALNPVMWSLVNEVQFYITIALLFVAFRPASYRICLAALPSLFFFIPAIVRFLYSSHGVYATINPKIDVLFPTQLDSFALGMLVGGLFVIGKIGDKAAGFGWVGLILLVSAPVLISAMGFTELDGNCRSELARALINTAGAFCLLFIGNQSKLGAQYLCIPYLRWFGIVSYEWYLFHQPVFLWLWRGLGLAGGNPWKYLFIICGSGLASLVLAACLYRWFSLPVLRYGRNKNRAI